MVNFLILFLQVTIVCTISLITLRLGEKALNSWLCLVAVSMNLFVVKQINLCGFDVTATDALAVGYLLGLNLIQEYYGKQSAREHVWISFLVSTGFLCLSFVQLQYIPNQFDLSQCHFSFILKQMPRIIFASIASFLIIQFLDISLFSILRNKLKGRYFTARTVICLSISQLLDTFIFSFLGLYNLAPHIWEIIIVSLIIKVIVIVLSAPFATLSKKILTHKLSP